MAYVEAYERVKHLSYIPQIIANPTLLIAVCETTRRAKYESIDLLAQEKGDKERNLLSFLESDDLGFASAERLTMEVLKGAVVALQQSNPHISDLLPPVTSQWDQGGTDETI